MVHTRTLYVGGLGPEPGRDLLDEIFEEFGGIEDARIVRRAGGEARGFAYVTLKDGAGAARARAELDGRDRDGRILRVELAR